MRHKLRSGTKKHIDNLVLVKTCQYFTR